MSLIFPILCYKKSAVRKAIVSMISTNNLVADIAHLHPSNIFFAKIYAR